MVLRRPLITVHTLLTTITLVLPTLGVEDVTVVSTGGNYKAADRNFLVQCNIESVGPTGSYDIIWRHNGTILTGDGRVTVSGASLAVSQAQVEDSGRYSCTVEGSAVTPVIGYLNITVERKYITLLHNGHSVRHRMLIHVYSLTHANITHIPLSFLVLQLIPRLK